LIFCQETEFIHTPIGLVPKDWEVDRIKDIAEINKESRDPSIDSPNETFQYVDIESVAGGSGRIKETKNLLGKEAPSRARRVIHENDVLMSTVRPYLKAFTIVPKGYENEICSTGFAVLRSKEKVNPRYLLYTLFSDNVISQCNRMMVGGQYPALNSSQVAEIKLSVPPMAEQRAIVEVLGVVDSAIELSDQIIAKTERLKRGLMQQLLTRGIGHTETKQTPIGQMPSDWVPTKIGDIAKLQSGGTPRRDVKEYWTNGKIPWLKSGELNDGEVCQAEERISQQGLDDSAAKIFPKGTLLMAMYGKGTVTKTGILGIEAATNQAVCAFIPKDRQFSPKFLQYSLIFKRNQLLGQLTNPSTDMGRTNIYAGMLASYQIPLPNKIEEQNKIAEIIQEADKKLKLEQLEKIKLDNIKRGLMDLLLTGRVRIKVD
jgi:type I restriction enzyme S subunit